MKLTATNKGPEIMIPRAKRIADSYRGTIHEQRSNYQRLCAKLAEAKGGVHYTSTEISSGQCGQRGMASAHRGASPKRNFS
jgi:hypothetical protein